MLYAVSSLMPLFNEELFFFDRHRYDKVQRFWHDFKVNRFCGADFSIGAEKEVISLWLQGQASAFFDGQDIFNTWNL